MKLYTAVFFAMLLCLISISLRQALFIADSLEKATQEVFAAYNADVFISQSFKKTCCGYGFENPEKWKQTCSALFSLEEISYGTVENNSRLFYAKWTGKGKLKKCHGCIYCVLKRSEL